MLALRVLVVVFALAAPVGSASAQVTAPETASGSYTVSWPASAGPSNLLESRNGGPVQRQSVAGRSSVTLTRGRGTYRYSLEYCSYEPELGQTLCFANGLSATVRVVAAAPVYCAQVRADRTGTGTPESVFDGSLSTRFQSSYANWQLIECDFGAIVPFDAIRRYMTDQSGRTGGHRGQQGESVSYSADRTTWTELTGSNTLGWSAYVNYGARSHAWHSVAYGWSAWLALRQTAQARYVRFHWDGAAVGEGLHEIELDYRPPPRPLAPPTLLSPAAGATVHPSTTLYSWGRVAGATRYLLCVSAPGAACTTSPTVTPATIVLDVGLATSEFPNLAAFDGTLRNWTVAACNPAGQCTYQQSVRPVQIVTPAPPPPTPGFDLQLGATSRTVTWGQSASFPVTIVPRNGYSQVVRVAVCNAPDGATATTLDLAPGNSGQLSIATTEAGTESKRHSLMIRAVERGNDRNPCSNVVGGGPPRDTATVTLDVTRIDGLFVSRSAVSSGPVTCTFGGDTFLAERVGSGGPAVLFRRNGVQIPPGSHPALYWAFSPKCRVAVAQHPASAGTLGMYNLAMPRPPARTLIGRSQNQPGAVYQIFRYSLDDSLVVLELGVGSPGGTVTKLALWDIFGGRQVCNGVGKPSDFDGVRLAAGRVEFLRRSSNGPIVYHTCRL